MEFNRKNAIISFLEECVEQKFTPYDIAKWLVANYPEEARRKANSSKNKDILKGLCSEGYQLFFFDVIILFLGKHIYQMNSINL